MNKNISGEEHAILLLSLFKYWINHYIYNCQKIVKATYSDVDQMSCIDWSTVQKPKIINAKHTLVELEPDNVLQFGFFQSFQL